MIFFTADQHFGHTNIIRFCNRPFENVDKMNKELTERWNGVVGKEDTVYVLGDFAWRKDVDYAKLLNGTKIFIRGSHGEKQFPFMLIIEIGGGRITLCHYAMRVWPYSHYGSWHLYGHSHGRLTQWGKSWDVGVDNNDFFPISFTQVEGIMSHQPENFNHVEGR